MPPTLLCVDADRGYCDILARAFRSEGYEVRTAHDGEAALAALDEIEPSLVTMDVLLPKCDGFSVLERIRGRGGNVPVVLLSGCSSTPGYRSRAAKLQASALLTKPVPLDRLLKLVSKQVGVVRAEVKAAKKLVPRGERPLSGALGEVSFAAVLHHLHGLRASGVLHLGCGKKRKKIQLREGRPVAIKSNLVDECLGNLLAASGKITPDVMHESLKRVKKGEGLQGQVLVAMHMLDEEDLTRALRTQAEEKFLEVFSWPQGQYRFQRGVRVTGANTLTIKGSPANLIMKGVRTRVPREHIDVFFREHAEQRPALSESPFYRFQEIDVERSAQELLDTLDGSRTLSDLLPLDDALRSALFGWAAIELVELRTDAQPRARKPAPTAQPTRSSRNVIETVVHRDARGDERPPPPKADPEADIRAELGQLAERVRDADYFDVLGVTTSATDDEVRDSYFDLAKNTHPDRYSGASDAVKRLAEEVFGVISKAYDALETTDARVAYVRAERDRERDAADIQEGERALRAELDFQKGIACLNRKGFSEALELFHSAVEAYPEEGEYHAYLGWATFLADADRIIEARDHVLAGRKLAPESEKPYLFLGRIYKAAGKMETAEKMFSQAIQVDPDCVDAIRELRLIDMRRQKSKSFVKRILRR